MDGPLATLFFKHLFSHYPTKCTRSTPRLPVRKVARYATGRGIGGPYSGRRGHNQKDDGVAWKHRTSFLTEDKQAEYLQYNSITAEELSERKRRPKRTKMLTRDFIEDSLYNPEYGYFSKEAVIFDAGMPFKFNEMSNGAEFQQVLGDRYTQFEDKLDGDRKNDSRQLWHTPTEIFKPHYAEAMASYLVNNYKLSLFPYDDLVIYELGAGNGTFMMEVLDYIREYEPQVYERTKYKIIEISPQLAKLQNTRVQGTARSQGHADKVEIINRSVFSWNSLITSPCFVVALEVIDNFAHDAIRYDFETEQPLQGLVLIDAQGEFYEFYSPELDPVAARYLRVRDVACSFPYKSPLRGSKLWRNMRHKLPWSPNLSEPEYIPTRLMQFFDVLQRYFPAHRLLLSDFTSLPNAIPGFSAPVVQTRYQRQMVPVTTPLVLQGYFDILFPTDFHVMEDIYRAITGKLTQVLSHEQFMKQWAYLDETRTKSGESPLLTWYKNAGVMTTV